MKTSCFSLYTGTGRISIARFAPRSTPAGYQMYKTLAPRVVVQLGEHLTVYRTLRTGDSGQAGCPAGMERTAHPGWRSGAGIAVLGKTR